MDWTELFHNQAIQRGLVRGFLALSLAAADSIHAGHPLRAVSAGIVAFSLLLGVIISVSVGLLGLALGPRASRRFGYRLGRAGGGAIILGLAAGLCLEHLVGRHGA